MEVSFRSGLCSGPGIRSCCVDNQARNLSESKPAQFQACQFSAWQVSSLASLTPMRLSNSQYRPGARCASAIDHCCEFCVFLSVTAWHKVPAG
jgi:hypothetical protein